MKPSVTAAAGCDIPGLLVRGIQGNRTNKRHFISISIYLSISISICLFIYMLAVGLVTNSCLTLVTPQTVARQAPLPMGFSRQGYWSGLPFPAPGDLPDPGIKLESPVLWADSLPAEPPETPLLLCSHLFLRSFLSLCPPVLWLPMQESGFLPPSQELMFPGRLVCLDWLAWCRRTESSPTACGDSRKG